MKVRPRGVSGRDNRFHRPRDPDPHPDAGGDPPPRHRHYGGYYAGYYCYPWYRHVHYTYAAVWFGFAVSPWYVGWAPPYRYGWVWSPGYWYFGWWHPGYWAPGPSVVIPVGYVYVPGWWESNTVYIEGYYRSGARDGWRWVDGHYLEDGTYIRGHWVPTGRPPEGYTWVPGFWNGEQWLEGFWRPEYRSGFRWLDGYYDEDGYFVAGYWEPIQDNVGFVWVPGWFDGNQWVEGYWMPESMLDEEPDWDPPEEGVEEPPVELPEDAPLAMPVDVSGAAE